LESNSDTVRLATIGEVVYPAIPVACTAAFKGALLLDPQDLDRGVDPDDGHGLTLLRQVIAHVDPPPPPEPPPCTHHPPSCNVDPKDYITASLATLCIIALFDGEPHPTIFVRSENNRDESKDYPITVYSDFGEIEQDATPSSATHDMTHGETCWYALEVPIVH
jgi:hypothetical protein